MWSRTVFIGYALFFVTNGFLAVINTGICLKTKSAYVAGGALDVQELVDSFLHDSTGVTF